MEQQYLLTFDLFIKELDKTIQSYCWFETNKDMEEFILDNDHITVLEKLKIIECEDLQKE